MLGSFAKGMKDTALAVGLKSYLNDRLRDYGEVMECQIDTGACRITIRALLKGEHEPISASVDRYELEREGEDRYITIKALSCSRQWLALLLNQRFSGQRYKLPSAVANFL